MGQLVVCLRRALVAPVNGILPCPVSRLRHYLPCLELGTQRFPLPPPSLYPPSVLSRSLPLPPPSLENMSKGRKEGRKEGRECFHAAYLPRITLAEKSSSSLLSQSLSFPSFTLQTSLKAPSLISSHPPTPRDRYCVSTADRPWFAD